jgi:hypothetical protein
MARREQWSTTRLTHQQNGRAWCSGPSRVGAPFSTGFRARQTSCGVANGVLMTFRGVAGAGKSVVIAIVRRENADERAVPHREWTTGSSLRRAFQRDDRQMSSCAVASNSKFDRYPGLPSHESLRRRAMGAAWPAWSSLKPRRSVRWSPAMVDLVGSCRSEPRVRPVAVVPGDVQLEFLLKVGETVGDRNKPPRVLVS